MIALLEKQLSNFFFLDDIEKHFIEDSYKEVYAQTILCLSKNGNKYYQDIATRGLNPLHTNSWAVFLYKFSRYCFLAGKDELAGKMYYLNKILNSVELFYAVELPQVFSFDHPLGSVMGRAKYGEYFTFSQGCTVGNNKNVYPVIGDFVSMMSNSKILGNSVIGNNVIIAANTYIIDTNVPDNMIVFGQGKNLVFKENKIDNRKNWILQE